METLRKLVTLMLLFALATTSIYGQDTNDVDDETVGSAYAEGSHAAHWSAYIPIGAIIIAAIFLGVADRDHKSASSHSGSNSQDGLGSIGSSSSGYSGYNYSSYSRGSYRSGHSH